jgi:hypothetical protein
LCRTVAEEFINADALPSALPSWTLEYVVGHLRGTIGDPALELLRCLDVEIPNEDHLLLAVHLARGGLLVTVNLDQGVEKALALLTGRDHLPDDYQVTHQGPLREWQDLVPDPAPELHLARGELEFRAWWTAGAPRPALLKLHGSLAGGSELIEPIVETEPELAQLDDLRLNALKQLGECDAVLVTGYSGADIDVYEPLLDRLRSGRYVWACSSYSPDSRVPGEVRSHGGEVRPVGEAGTAVVNLRALLGMSRDTPRWPAAPASTRSEALLADSLATLAARTDALTEAYAWMLLDADEYTVAIVLLRALGAPSRSTSSAIHLAEALSLRNQGSDRREARRYFASVVIRAPIGDGHKTLALVRFAETLRSEQNRPALLWRAIGLGLTIVGRLVAEIDDRSGVQGARADSALGHFILRMVESALASGLQDHGATRAALRLVCRGGLHFQREALGPSPGNRRTFVRQQTIELDLLMRILGGQLAPRHAEAGLLQIQGAYAAATDARGVANSIAALAFVAMANREYEDAAVQLDIAEKRYAVSGRPDPSGILLVARRRRILDRLRRS